jgi:hypothetical protein
MPSVTIPLHAARRSAPSWIVTVAVALVPVLAAADHLGGVGAVRGGGLDWISWLLVAGAVAAVSLAAWAFFAPDRTDGRADPPPPDRSEREPPAR